MNHFHNQESLPPGRWETSTTTTKRLTLQKSENQHSVPAIKISLESWWSERTGQLLTELNNPAHPVVNWSPEDPDQVAQNYLTTSTNDSLLRRYLYQLTRPVLINCSQPFEMGAVPSPPIHLYYNLHGLRSIYYELEQREWNPNERLIYESAENNLNNYPDYIIYVYSHSDLRTAPEKVGPLYYQYEWEYDGNNITIPVFKVNADETFHNVLLAIEKIINVIRNHERERYETELSLSLTNHHNVPMLPSVVTNYGMLTKGAAPMDSKNAMGLMDLATAAQSPSSYFYPLSGTGLPMVGYGSYAPSLVVPSKEAPNQARSNPKPVAPPSFSAYSGNLTGRVGLRPPPGLEKN